MVVSASLSLRSSLLVRPAAAGRCRSARRLGVVPRANALADVGKYLSEAASQIFYPQENDTPWKGTGTPFTGSIVHHEAPSRLRLLNEMVEKVKLEMEASGQVDPQAVGAMEADEKVPDDGLQDYMTQAVARLFGHNFTGDEGSPETWASTGYSGSWRKGSRREVQRQYDRLVRFQKVVKKTLEEAEAKK